MEWTSGRTGIDVGARRSEIRSPASIGSESFDEQNEMTRFECPCCTFLTLTERPPGTFAVCAVCGWEDDLSQFRDPDFTGGANSVSLRQARENFATFGAVTKDMHAHVGGQKGIADTPNKSRILGSRVDFGWST